MNKYPFMALMLSVPLLVHAGNVSVPNTFVNGEVVDADEINANYTAIATEVNDNDSRLTGLEANLAAEPLQVFRFNNLDAGPYTFGVWNILPYTQFNFDKGLADSSIKVTWTDSSRALNGSCSWHLTIDESPCSPSPIVRMNWSGGSAAEGASVDDQHSSSSITQVCEGLTQGSHTLEVSHNFNPVGTECMRGFIGLSGPTTVPAVTYPASIIVEEFPN